MNEVLQLLGVAATWIGVVFCALGVVGLIRLPDVYCRLHASGKVATLGLFGLLVGTALLLPATTAKVLVLILFLLIASPIASHAIARAAQAQAAQGEPAGE